MPHWKKFFSFLIVKITDFVRQTGFVIVCVSIVVWFLSSYPVGAKGILSESFLGKLGFFLEPWVRPLGFNWKIAVCLIPGFFSREVLIGSLATIYGVEMDQNKTALTETLGAHLPVSVGLSLLVFYVFALQCVSTLVVLKKETHSFVIPGVIFFVLTLLAYSASFLTYRFSCYCGL
jgi:ferrous iron transport protein B